jgi:Tfp pilus assembly protein PilF
LACSAVAAIGLVAGGGCSSWGSGKSAKQASANPYPGATLPPDDPTSLSGKPAKPGPDLYVATAEVYQANDNLDAAAAQYDKALKIDRDYLPAMLGLAHLQDQRQNYAESDVLYRRALKVHPNDATALNDWALSYQRRGALDKAADTLQRAVAAQPRKTLYRNNLAKVLVEMNRPEEAFRQMAAAEGPAVAHFNLGALYYKKGNQQLAMYHFMQASQADPSLAQARQWVDRIAANSRRQMSGPALVAADQRPPAMPPAMPAAAPVVEMRPAPAPPQPPVVVAAKLRGVKPLPADAADDQPAELNPPEPRMDVAMATRPALPTTPPNDTYAVRYPAPSSPPPSADAMPPLPERLPNLPMGGTGLVPLPPVE